MPSLSPLSSLVTDRMPLLSIRSIRTDRQTVYPINEVLFTDRKTLFTDRIPLLSIRSIRTDRQTVYNHSCHENIISPTNEMRFTDRKTLFTDRIPLLSIRSIRADRHMAYTDRYGVGVLDNPLQF